VSSFTLAVNAINPGEYLAVCGLIELVSRLDKSATSAWTRRSGLVPKVQTAVSDACEIQTCLEETEFARRLSIALGSRAAWSAVTDRGRVPLCDAVAQWTAGIEFTLPDGGTIVVDHWYSWAFLDGDHIVQRLGKRDGKSEWKFWAGQQDSKQGITGLLLDLVDASSRMAGVTSLRDILAFASPGSSRLNVDAATTRSAIDRGISANDVAADGGCTGRPGLELLAAIGLPAFFPPRRYGDAAPDGTVGVYKRLFRYCTWSPQAPISVARLCARGVAVPGFDSTPREATIGMMGQYKYLRFARPAGVGWTATASEGAIDVEAPDENANG
jgi:CRISPR-associated protein Csb3